MSGNTFGIIFRLTTFGESHSTAVGGIIDGCPAGLLINTDFIKSELDRRKPHYPGSTARKEPDAFEILSGVENDLSLGTPIGFMIRNSDIRKYDYQNLADVFRPSHADFTQFKKYGFLVSGGGRSSGRETSARVVAGDIAKLFLKNSGIEIIAEPVSIGGIPFDDEKSQAIINEAEKAGDTLGGTIKCRITGVPAGLGEPVFDKMQADLAKAMLGIGSAKGFEYGYGFKAADMKGSEYNDRLAVKNNRLIHLTNHDGGIQGGITNGEEINFRVGFKPVPSVRIPQSTVNKNGNQVEIKITGRHDTCHIPRLVVVVESMAALVLADHMLRNRSTKI
jgi:chorismate synthase